VTPQPADGYLAGRGIADVTGEAAECGMLGYGKAKQQTEGIHTRLRSRAFVIADAKTAQRLLVVVNDLPMVFESVHREVLRRLAGRYGQLYTDTNVLLTATHTHCGPGGYSHHRLYNSNTHGFRPLTFASIVDGIMEAVKRAHADVAPATLVLTRGELLDASVNRSKTAFDRNPESDRHFFPDAIDPQTTLLRIERDGRAVGVINWFATHCTSMTNHNRLISSDNKGHASWHWERLVEGVDYRADTEPAFVAAFAQTNAGDMSPNLQHQPGRGPTDDELDNTRIIGERQYQAAARLLTESGAPMTGGVDARVTYIDLAGMTVGAEVTGDGREHRTGAPAGGAAAFAGAWDDGRGYPGFRQGANPLFDAVSRAAYRVMPRLRDAQAPKGIALPGLFHKRIPLVQTRVPVQLLRIGRLYLIGVPGEVTITAGLRLRRTVAEIAGADVHDVLVAGYSNAYIHYVTTPEEYDAQRYEGGSTLFGRWELPALQQTVAGLARTMRAGEPVGRGQPPSDRPRKPRDARSRRPVDEPPPGRQFGAVLSSPRPAYAPGERVTVAFAGAYPNNNLRRGDTYLEVQRARDEAWETIADDGDWSTTFRWAPLGRSASRITITWDIPAATGAGTYRIKYRGDIKNADGTLSSIEGTSEPFEVTG